MGQPKLDDVTHSAVMLEQMHHEIHEGDAFHLSNQQTIANVGSFNYLIVTPNTSKFTHMFVNVVSQAEAQETLFEGVTVTNSGTALTGYNRNRTNTSTPKTEVFLTPTVVSSGAIIQIKNWGTGKSIGDVMRSENEWLLNSGTVYMVNSKNNTTSNNLVTTWLNWYEHSEES